MKFEDLIRKKHALQNSVKVYAKLISLISNQEIEIALARLADQFSEQTADEHHLESIRKLIWL